MHGHSFVQKNILSDYDEEKLFLKIKDEISGKKGSLNPAIKIVFKYAAIIVFFISLTTIYYTSKQPSNFMGSSEKLSFTSFITENGQRSKIILPDSSIVWLNSGTTLSYPINFSMHHRKVELTGQAFFSGLPQRKQPIFSASEWSNS